MCWFKRSALRPIEYAWDVVHVLRETGRAVEMVRTAQPGTILYEDGFQVVAMPLKRDRLRRV